MDLGIRDKIKSDFAGLSNDGILAASTAVILGVTPAAAEALKFLSINTVFDLATSEVFATAARIRDAATEQSAISRFGKPSADWVKTAALSRTAKELPSLDLNFLARVPDDKATAIRDALAARSIRDLANYPPRRAAESVLQEIYFPDSVSPGRDNDEETPDLVPATGQYPVEKVQYTHVVLDEVKISNANQARVDITSAGFTPIDLMALAGADGGFKSVAMGALLTINQEWYSQGLSLGQLLHSVALAPGESTRIAVLDWSRKTRANRAEALDEQTDLSQNMASDRAINEVTRATANEMQAGSSHSQVKSQSTQNATSTAAELSAPFGGLLGGPSGSMGTSNSNGTSDTTTDGYSVSTGSRNVGTSVVQNVHDRTHQNAHGVRGQRASVVMEVSEQEKESVSTRVLANYNHCHALNIHYYEVIQLFKTRVSIAKAEKLVFIPFKLADFDSDAFIRRFQGVLANAAPTSEIRDLIQNSDVIRLAPEKTVGFAAIGGLQLSDAILGRGILGHSDILRVNPAIFPRRPITVFRPTQGLNPGAAGSTSSSAPAPTATQPTVTTAEPPTPVKMTSVSLHRELAQSLWDTSQVSRLSALLNRQLLRPNSTGLYIPVDITIVDTSVSPGDASIKEVIKLKNGTLIEDITSSNAVRASEVDKIFVRGGSADKDTTAKVTLTMSRNGVVFPLELPGITIKKGATGETTVVVFQSSGIGANLKQYLKENASYFNMAILRSLTTTQIAMLLSGYDITVGEGAAAKLMPVAQLVEPRPVRYVGNYLAFKMNVEAGDAKWATWLADRGLNGPFLSENLVPMPTGGTFAEAVLGRSNSAEKLDMTRFWNWQDSPIPLMPTDIASVQMGSRSQGTPEGLAPTPMGAPIVNLMQPQHMPDPTGTAAVLAAIQNGNMFRDMSGMTALVAAGQAATQATQTGATSAGQQAGENMNNLLKANTERQRVAAEMITSLAKTAAGVYTGGLAGGGGGGISSGGAHAENHSQKGALFNTLEKTAKTEVVPESTPATPPAPTPATGGTSGGGGGQALAPPPPAAPARPPTTKKVYTKNPAVTDSRTEVVDKILNSSKNLGQTSKDPRRERILELRVLNVDNALLVGDWQFVVSQRSPQTGTATVGSGGESLPGGNSKLSFTPIVDDPALDLLVQGAVSQGAFAGSHFIASLVLKIPPENWAQNEAFRADLRPASKVVKTKGKDMKETATKLELELKANAKASWAAEMKGLAYKVIDITARRALDIEIGGSVKWTPLDETKRFENEVEMDATVFTEGMSAENVM